MEICENCGRAIGNLETPTLWRDRVVCGECHKRLKGSEATDEQAGQEAMATAFRSEAGTATPYAATAKKEGLKTFCTACGKQIDARAVICVHCGRSTTAQKAGIQADPVMRMLLPIGRSGYAIVAGYLGLLSVLLIFAPFALIFGILAVRDIRTHKEKHGMGRVIFGIVMGAVCSAWGIFVLLNLLGH